MFSIIGLTLAVACLNAGFTDAYKLLDGDVTIAGLFDIQSEANGHCGDVNVPSVMVVEAVRRYLTKINEDGTLPFKLGLTDYKTCGNTGLAAQHAVEILSRYRRARITNSSEDFIVGVIGPMFSSEAQVVSSILGSQLPSDRFLQIGFSSTSTVLNDRTKYPNYYRVIPGDSIQVDTMVHLMTSLEWNRIAVIYENDTYGRIGAESLKVTALRNDICISQMYPITIDSSRHVDIAQIKSIIDKLVVKSPSVQGAVYLGGQAVARSIFQIINNLQFTEVPIFIMSESTQLQLDAFQSLDGTILSDSKGTLSVSTPYSEDNDLKDYWNSLFTDIEKLGNASLGNPYLKDVFKAYSGCNVRDDTCTALTDAQINEKSPKQPVYVKYAIFAAHTLVEALRKVSETICQGKCSSVQDFKKNFGPSKALMEMDTLSVTYNGLTVSFTKDSANAQLGQNQKEYEVYNLKKVQPSGKFEFVNVGYMSNGELTLDTNQIKDYYSDGTERSFPNVRKGQCPVTQVCTECIHSDMTEVDFHIPGDFYVVGIVSINNRAIPGPQGCGKVRTRHGYQMYLTLEFSLKEFMTRSWYTQFNTKFAGHTVGIIVINSCNNALEVVRKILNLHSSGLKLPNGEKLDVTNRILGYVGGQSTDVSAPAAEQLTKLEFVQISYSSTNPVLSNKDLYPYFLRIITPDNVQAKAMIDIVKELGGEYIQIVYSEGAYGEGGRDAVVAAAAEALICIAQEILVTEKDVYYEHYETLRRKPHAKLVIVFLRSHVVKSFMRDMNTEMKRGEFQFIGSEAWGKNTDILQYDINKGSITVAVEMDKNTYLEEYLKVQEPTHNASDPWLEEYIQNRQDCYFDWSYDKKFSRKCVDNILPVSDVDFESDPWCIFVFNTMISFLKGAATFYQQTCGASSSKELCEDFVSNPNNFVKVLKNVKMNIYGTGDILIYDSRGDGLMGYKVYNIKDTADRTSRTYTPVGSYSLNGGLQFAKNEIDYPTDEKTLSTCPSEKACQGCQPAPPTTEPTAKKSSDSTVIALGAVIGVCCLIILILIIVIIVFRKRSSKRQTDSTYLTPTSVQQGMQKDMMFIGGEERQIGEGAHTSDGSDFNSSISDEKF
ncbi:uncharacterized protein LOC123561535 [Mercenaria mercenaria]|uniref:uncharacterized protein LOC123561535 n=1 Tax=Mercenaria mercenaria TaxID=6596 RepID=UPI00234F026E|nr:uncharacterized protein LOC123561535 [Mercenaria mercenaria]